MAPNQSELNVIPITDTSDELIAAFVEVRKMEFILTERLALHADIEELGLKDDLYYKSVRDIEVSTTELEQAQASLNDLLSKSSFSDE